jgi:sialic acid synthase SpsE
MVLEAARAGAQAVKFQTFVPERLVSPLQAERLAVLRRFQLSRDQFAELAGLARDQGLAFLSTPFDPDSARFLDRLVPAFKIASGDNDFWPLLEAVAATGKPVLLSTGLSGLAQVRRSLDFLREAWAGSGVEGRAVVMHCVSSYPTPAEEANLAALGPLAGLGQTVGYSDHTLGIEAAVMAVALGARVVEKHFTLDKRLSDFRDHQLSADPEEMAELVRRVRLAESLLGGGGKGLRECEREVAVAARRSVVAGRDLPAGTVLGLDDLDWLRPGGGLPPGGERELIGRRLAAAKRCGEMILPDDLTPEG